MTEFAFFARQNSFVARHRFRNRSKITLSDGGGKYSSGEESLESIDDGFGKPLTQIKCLPSDLTIEKKAAKEVTKLLEKHENAAVSRYLKKYLEDWRQQKVGNVVFFRYFFVTT